MANLHSNLSLYASCLVHGRIRNPFQQSFSLNLDGASALSQLSERFSTHVPTPMTTLGLLNLLVKNC